MQILPSVFRLLLLSSLFISCGAKSSIELSPEMSEFIEMINGTSADVSAALGKFAVNEELADDDLATYNLKDPKVLSKNGNCYIVKFKSAMIYIKVEICWKDGKIISLSEK